MVKKDKEVPFKTIARFIFVADILTLIGLCYIDIKMKYLLFLLEFVHQCLILPAIKCTAKLDRHFVSISRVFLSAISRIIGVHGYRRFNKRIDLYRVRIQMIGSIVCIERILH
jgi:hypothetical protein